MLLKTHAVGYANDRERMDTAEDDYGAFSTASTLREGAYFM